MCQALRSLVLRGHAMQRPLTGNALSVNLATEPEEERTTTHETCVPHQIHVSEGQRSFSTRDTAWIQGPERRGPGQSPKGP